MDPDPFSIWADPEPSASEMITKSHIKQDNKLLQDDDPGWGYASANNSPQNSKKTIALPVHDDNQQSSPSTFSFLTTQPTTIVKEQSVQPVQLESDNQTNEQQSETVAETSTTSLKRLSTDESVDTQEHDQQEGHDAPSNDDFNDFDDQHGGANDDDDDDDFGDFDNDDAAQADFQEHDSPPPQANAPPIQAWSALKVTSQTKKEDLYASVQDLLPMSTAAENEMTKDGLRQVEGMAQVLVAEQSRQLWNDLCGIPAVRPIDWVRSRTRRDYLITMGIPVNLDEIHHSYGSSSSSSQSILPPLKLKLDTSVGRVSGANSAPVDGNNKVALQNTETDASTSVSNSSSNKQRLAEKRREELGLGPPPHVDLQRAQDLVSRTEDQLTLLTLPALQAMLHELNSLTTATSALLTHHLTLRESYQADSEMYNSMIKELVTGAASRFSGAAGSTANRGDRKATAIGVKASTVVKNKTPATISSNHFITPSVRGGAAAAASPRR